MAPRDPLITCFLPTVQVEARPAGKQSTHLPRIQAIPWWSILHADVSGMAERPGIHRRPQVCLSKLG